MNKDFIYNFNPENIEVENPSDDSHLEFDDIDFDETV